MLAAFAFETGRHGLRSLLWQTVFIRLETRQSSSATRARSLPSTSNAKCSSCSGDRAAEEKVTNIEPVLGTVVDPKLPPGSIDVILLVDVYHEFSNPEEMLAVIRKSLKPSGRIALAEFRAEDPKVPIKPLHKMSKAQIMKEFPPNGFKLVEEFDKLPWQHLMFFERDDAPQNTAKFRRCRPHPPNNRPLDWSPRRKQKSEGTSPTRKRGA